MKAAVIQKFGDTPRYAEFPDPVAGGGDVPVKVRAAVLENFDKLTASGKHYASKHMFPVFPAIVGHIGVGELEDGTLVTFGGSRPPYGVMAQIVARFKARDVDGALLTGAQRPPRPSTVACR